MNENKSNDLQTIITQVIKEMKSEQGDKFDLCKINLAELERRTGLTRAQVRRLKKNGFQVIPHALTGRKADATIISGYTGVINDLLKKGVSNSEVILERIREHGYTGSLTTVKRYISTHKDLIPPKRQAVAPQGNRGRRYSSDAGETYQMDWGFVNVDTSDGNSYKVACFAMICHHCGERYIEFFPNAHAHQFRHAKASHWLEDGINVVQVSFLLGHEQLETTMRYLDITTEDKIKALATLEDETQKTVPKKWKNKNGTLTDFCGLKK